MTVPGNIAPLHAIAAGRTPAIEPVLQSLDNPEYVKALQQALNAGTVRQNLKLYLMRDAAIDRLKSSTVTLAQVEVVRLLMTLPVPDPSTYQTPELPAVGTRDLQFITDEDCEPNGNRA